MAASETDVSKRKEAATIRQRRAKVSYSYEPQNEDELALKVGDELVISGEDEEGWYQATLNGKSGVCPSNFVELLPDALEDMDKDKDKDKEKKTNASESATKHLQDKTVTRGKEGGDLPKRQSVLDTPTIGAAEKTAEGQDEASAVIQPKKVVGMGFGVDLFGGGGPSKKSLRPTSVVNGGKDKITGSADKKTSVTSNEATAKKDSAGGLEFAKADYDYQALNSDELSFKSGDIIRIITKECEDEGWWRGELDGQSGVFPDNFCSVIPLSEVPVSKRPGRTSSIENGGSLKKNDKNEKENHDKEKEKDKIDKNTTKKDDPHPDKVEKTATTTTATTTNATTATKDDSAFKTKLDKTVSKPLTAAGEKKPDRPEKPVLKPVPGKKPVAGGSRENTPPVHEKEGGRPDLKAAVDAKAKSEVGGENAKHADESRPRGGSGTSGTSGTGASEVRLRHVDSSESKLPSATSSATAGENGGVAFDSVNSSEKLVHHTASRARGPPRRPPSQLFRPEDGPLFGVNGSNGVDIITDDMAKDREPKADSRRSTLDAAGGEKSRDSVARKDSFLKQLDSTLGHAPKSPTSLSRRVSDLPSSSTGSLEEEVKTLKEEIKSLKEDFAMQLKEVRGTLKQQAEKISSLERDLEKARKTEK